MIYYFGSPFFTLPYQLTLTPSFRMWATSQKYWTIVSQFPDSSQAWAGQFKQRFVIWQDLQLLSKELLLVLSPRT